jgi:antitoxin MazE
MEGIMALVKVKRNFQVTIPGKLRKIFNIMEGDYLDVEKYSNGMFIRPVKIVHPDQEYFYTKEWQKGEAEADKDIAEGKVAGPFGTVDDLVEELDS